MAALRIRELIALIPIPGGLPGGPEMAGMLEAILRKGAHMTEFAVCLLLLYLAFLDIIRWEAALSVSIIISFLWAVSDEFHQTFVSGRSGSPLDVSIDMSGVLIMVTIILIIHSLKRKNRGI